MSRAIDLAHAAGAYRLQDLIRTKFRAAIQAHDRILSALPEARPRLGSRLCDCTAHKPQTGTQGDPLKEIHSNPWRYYTVL
jgi:hypothetical protein